MDTVCIACAFLVILARSFILNTASYMENRYGGIGNVVLVYGNQVLMDISLQSRHVRISSYRSTHLPPSRSGWQLPWLLLTSLHLVVCSTWLAWRSSLQNASHGNLSCWQRMCTFKGQAFLLWDLNNISCRHSLNLDLPAELRKSSRDIFVRNYAWS